MLEPVPNPGSVHRLKRFRRVVSSWTGPWLIAGTLWGGGLASAAEPEYAIKAVFVYRFTSFVRWPDTVFAAPDAPFVVGVLGHDPFGGELEAAMKNERVGTHPITVRHLGRAAELESCHLVFVPSGEEPALRGRKLTALTVGETEAFLANGGDIRLATEHNRIKMQIDLQAAHNAGLSISSQLLRIAEIVDVH